MVIFNLPSLKGTKSLSLGEALSLDEDQLDEIFTNNETDEACLEEMLEHYLQRSDLNHSWKEIEAALEKIKKASGEFIYMYMYIDAPHTLQQSLK